MRPSLPLTPGFRLSRCSARLLRTTALLSLLPLLAAITPVRAEILLDNAQEQVPSVPPRAVSGTWSLGDEIWYDTDATAFVALGAGQEGILNANGNITLTVGGQHNIGGLTFRVQNGAARTFTFQGNQGGGLFGSNGLTNATGPLVLRAEDTNNARAIAVLRNDMQLSGEVNLEGALTLRNQSALTAMTTLNVGAGARFENLGTMSGDILNAGETALGAGSTLGGDVENDNLLTLSGGAQIGGDVVNRGLVNFDNATASNPAQIGGNLDNYGQIDASDDGGAINIDGRFSNYGVLRAGLLIGQNLTITANEILLGSGSDIDVPWHVTLRGTEVVQDSRLYVFATTLDQGTIDGGLLIEGAGRVTVRTNLGGSGYSITNQNRFDIVNRPILSTSVHSVDQFVNQGSAAVLGIQSDGSLIANALTNTGTVTNEGRIAAEVTNAGTGLLTNTGTISGNVSNAATATVVSSGTINGNLTNAGRALLEGRINGLLMNSTALPPEQGLELTGDLRVSNLENSGSMVVDGAMVLSVDNQADNSGSLDV
ncbi:MAG: hypothetical protein Q4G26_10610, partial [Paracoccus sp. (in: a-proteobacteria)]|nr:hypothetical protein [Paracoccus sp. (in: a-proteobacteria)]